MTSSDGNPAETRQLQRELEYYRTTCNELGGKLIRVQEEQSAAFREARRNLTVVKLLREAYLLGEAASMRDTSGPMIEIVAEYTLCDRAALLREEPERKGTFLIIQSIGLPQRMAQAAVELSDPPPFCYRATNAPAEANAATLADVIGLPYLLWAYDKGNGYALLLGNRTETNVSRPFEEADQLLIETALAVYLDVLRRRRTEMQLRAARRAAENAGAAHAAFLELLGRELRPPLQMITGLANMTAAAARVAVEPRENWRGRATTIAEMSRHLLDRIDDTLKMAEVGREETTLDCEWTPLEEMLRSASRSPKVIGQHKGVDMLFFLPARRLKVWVDPARLQTALCGLFVLAIKAGPPVAGIEVHARRREDGDLQISVSSNLLSPSSDISLLESVAAFRGDLKTATPTLGSLLVARRTIEAHGGSFALVRPPNGGLTLEVCLPAHIVRDDEFP